MSDNHDDHTPHCIISGIASMVNDAICELYDSTESLRDRLNDPAMEQIFRVISSLELGAQALESLAEDVSGDDEHDEEHGEPQEPN